MHARHAQFPRLLCQSTTTLPRDHIGRRVGPVLGFGCAQPSPAIALASFGLPFLTFFAITSFILRNQELSVFSVIVVAYGFATAAMIIPALSEFDFALGRSRAAEEE